MKARFITLGLLIFAAVFFVQQSLYPDMSQGEVFLLSLAECFGVPILLKLIDFLGPLFHKSGPAEKLPAPPTGPHRQTEHEAFGGDEL